VELARAVSADPTDGDLCSNPRTNYFIGGCTSRS